jgi:hypothetical protein
MLVLKFYDEFLREPPALQSEADAALAAMGAELS